MSGLFQHSITIYTKYNKGMDNWTGGTLSASSIAWGRTLIHNVMWKDKVYTGSNNGKAFIDKTVSITIPLKEMEVEGDKRYVKPQLYTALYTDGGDVWTINIGDIIVFGECGKEISNSYTIADLQKEYKSMKIQAVADSTEQDIIPKWEISGV
jgi:hypothetical protein